MDNSTVLPKNYDSRAIESRWSMTLWNQEGTYHANADGVLQDGKAGFSILMPPPNITGSLTIGHVLNHTIQDILIRYHRKSGFESLWLPGTDHAGIATQTVVEKHIKKEKLTRYDLGREAFLERVWQWRDEYGNLILKQLATLGDSADWRRLLFTMDERANRAVRNAFITLYRNGLIYRGERIINWCPVSQTALSDEEVDMRTQRDALVYVKYRLVGNPERYIPVATVRPETMLGDVAVAVHPDDERYQDLIGQKVIEPLTQREIPVIADTYVEKDFGTGALKITPAHDPNDYAVGLRHRLPIIVALDQFARISEGFPPYSGLDRFEARKKIIADLQAGGLVIKIEDYEHNVGYSERAGVVVEPFLSLQWFVKMKPLSIPALDAVEKGYVRFVPERWINTYRYWMEGIQDWCISRQLWWGHRIPVYYTPKGGMTAAESLEEAYSILKKNEPELHLSEVTQDEDVLDTWFSSWLWPLTTLGWEKPGDSNPDFEAFYPTGSLVTGPDIIFFWVARMIMAGLYFRATDEERQRYFSGSKHPESPEYDNFLKKNIPFRDVYFTSIIRDQQGRKLSKSLGNSPDPLLVMDKYGTDALRFTVMFLAPLGQDLRIEVNLQTKDMPQVEQGRNFCTKIWNATRFLIMNRDELFESEAEFGAYYSTLGKIERTAAPLSLNWMDSLWNATLRDYHHSLKNFRFNEMVKGLYDVLWRDFCDWYLEMLKVDLQAQETKEGKQTLICHSIRIFDEAMSVLHPVMPYITEEVWHALAPRPKGAFLASTPIPHADPTRISEDIETTMNRFKDIVSSIRSIRTTLSVPPALEVQVILGVSDEAGKIDLLPLQSLINKLGRVSTDVRSGFEKPKRSVGAVAGGCDVILLLDGVIDPEKERQRLEKEIQKLEQYLRQIDQKLSNQGFRDRAPQEVIAAEEQKRDDTKHTLERLRENLVNFAENA